MRLTEQPVVCLQCPWCLYYNYKVASSVNFCMYCRRSWDEWELQVLRKKTHFSLSFEKLARLFRRTTKHPWGPRLKTPVAEKQWSKRWCQIMRDWRKANHLQVLT